MQALKSISGAPKRKSQADVELAEVLKMYKAVDDDLDEYSGKPFVERPPFNCFIGVVVVLNAVMIGIETDLGPKGPTPISKKLFWYGMENAFLLIFFGEMLLRFWFLRLGYFKDLWNLLDFILVWLSITDTWLMTLVLKSEGNLRALSTLRVVRIMRLARLIRLLKSLKELWLIVNGLMESMRTLFWVSLLLVLMLYVCAILLTMLVGQNDDLYDDYLKVSGGWDHEVYFGTVPASMYTLFQVVTLESWADLVARHVVTKQPPLAVFFLLFVLVTSFGLMNMVVGVIVEQTLTAAANNEDKIRDRQEKERGRSLEYLREIFEMADNDRSGTLEKEEFEEALNDEEVQKKLKLVDLSIEEAQALFMVLDSDGSGSLSVDEFIGGCLRLKGNSASKDLLAVQISVEGMAKKVDTIESLLGELEARMNTLNKVTIKMSRRYENGVEEAHRRMEASLGGTCPIVVTKGMNETKGVGAGGPPPWGGRPWLPPFPGFLQ